MMECVKTKCYSGVKYNNILLVILMLASYEWMRGRGEWNGTASPNCNANQLRANGYMLFYDIPPEWNEEWKSTLCGKWE